MIRIKKKKRWDLNRYFYIKDDHYFSYQDIFFDKNLITPQGVILLLLFFLIFSLYKDSLVWNGMNVVPRWVKRILMWGIILPLVGLTITALLDFIATITKPNHEPMRFLLWTIVEQLILITPLWQTGIIVIFLVRLCPRSARLATKSFLNPLIVFESVRTPSS